jgi:cation diffusion facilitator family transporter
VKYAAITANQLSTSAVSSVFCFSRSASTWRSSRGKLVAGILAGSLSVISDAIHSSVDSLNNIVGLVVTKYASAEPDENHPYGHAKFETLAAFVIAGFLFVTCYQLGLSALSRIFDPPAQPPEISWLTIGVMIVTIATNVVVTVYEHREGKRLQSDFLIADAIHTRSDVAVSCAILVGLLPDSTGLLLARSGPLARRRGLHRLERIPDLQKHRSRPGR